MISFLCPFQGFPQAQYSYKTLKMLTAPNMDPQTLKTLMHKQQEGLPWFTWTLMFRGWCIFGPVLEAVSKHSTQVPKADHTHVWLEWFLWFYGLPRPGC